MTAADAAHSGRGEPAAPVSSTGQALSHLRVLDLTGAGSQYCGRLMADLGADVVKVEPPEGEATRERRPFVGREPGEERGIPFLSLNVNKRSVALDLDSEAIGDASRRWRGRRTSWWTTARRSRWTSWGWGTTR